MTLASMPLSGFSQFKASVLALILKISLIVFTFTLLTTPTMAANSASFVRMDTTTAGNWLGNYGADGYQISQNGNVKIPSYAQLTFKDKGDWVWADSPGGWVALQKPENTADRIAGVWFGGTSFTIDVNLTDDNTHQIALYALDYDNLKRAQTITVLDATTNAVLDTRPLEAGSFGKGAYVVWNVQGHVTFKIEKTGPGNAVISGVFFGGGPTAQTATLAVPANTFLSSMGVNTHVAIGYPEPQYEAMLNYTGLRNIRDGSSPQLVTLHNKTGVMVTVIGTNLIKHLNVARSLASAGGLLALEGPNEPNNFPFSYNGQKGGKTETWLPIAQYQRDLYAGVKADPVLKNYPVFSITEPGAQTDNVGLQFLSIPAGAGTLMPDGTLYADYASMHNYVMGWSRTLVDNKAWDASDPIIQMNGEYGKTWLKHYAGNSKVSLLTLPRVTTETGWVTKGTKGTLTEDQQGRVFLNMFLDQFKRGWSYTFIYQMVDYQGDPEAYGLYRQDLTPKLSATYIHNFTEILADTVTKPPGTLTYSIPLQPAVVHDLLLQKSDGTFYLAVWGERVSGGDSVTVKLASSHASVKIYDPTVGTAAVQSLSNVSSIPLSLTDHPLILAISAI